MLVSAIMTNKVNRLPYYGLRANDPKDETTFNSLTPYLKQEPVPTEDESKVFDNINEWKNYCHSQIVGSKLNVIA